MRRILVCALLAVAGTGALAAPALAFPPTARTDSPTEVTADGATLHGLAAPNGSNEVVTYHFEYGATTAYGSQTPEKQAPPFAPPTPPTVSDRVALPGGSTFHYRIVATNPAGEKGAGQDIEWKTPGRSPGARRRDADLRDARPGRVHEHRGGPDEGASGRGQDQQQDRRHVHDRRARRP